MSIKPPEDLVRWIRCVGLNYRQLGLMFNMHPEDVKSMLTGFQTPSKQLWRRLIAGVVYIDCGELLDISDKPIEMLEHKKFKTDRRRKK